MFWLEYDYSREKIMLGGHTLIWVLGHEAWHYVFSLSFSLVLLSAVFFLSSATSGRFMSVSRDAGYIPLTFVFLLSVSLALVWHFILDIDAIALGLRFWW